MRIMIISHMRMEAHRCVDSAHNKGISLLLLLPLLIVHFISNSFTVVLCPRLAKYRNSNFNKTEKPENLNTSGIHNIIIFLCSYTT